MHGVIKRAYLIGGDASPATVIGGLPTLLRQALSLQHAGIDEIVLVGVEDHGLLRDHRLGLAVRRASTETDRSGRDAIVARAGSVWHPKLARRLARTAIGPDEIVAVGSGNGTIYLCGRRRTAVSVAALAANARLDADRGLPIAAGEFVSLPETAADCRTATRQLFRSLDKPTDGLVARHLDRHVSKAVTRMLLPSGITPNMTTLVSAMFGAAGVFAAFEGGYRNLLIGAILFEIQNVLDGCDGEIARLKYLGSRAGEWLDQSSDDVLNIAFLVAIGLALARGGRSWAWWVAVVSLVAQSVHVVGLYAGLIVKARGRGSVAALRWWVGGERDSGSRTLGDLTRRDFLSAAYVVTAAFDVVFVAFAWHALVIIGSAIVTTVQWIVWNGPEVQAETDVASDPFGGSAA